MKCDEFSKMLDNYENLTENERADMYAHSEECAKCKKELDFMLSVKNALRTLPKLEVPSDFIDKLNERIDREEAVVTRRDKLMRHIKTNGRRYSAIAASLVLAAVIGVNGKPMLDTLKGNDNGVISESSSTAKPSGTTNPSDNTSANADKNASEKNSSSDNDNARTAFESADGVKDNKLSAQEGAFVASQGSVSTPAAESKNEASVLPAATADNAADNAQKAEAQPRANQGSVSNQDTAQADKDKAVRNEEADAAATFSTEGYSVSGGALDTYAYSGGQTGRSVQTVDDSESLADYHFAVDGMITIQSGSYDDAITVIAKYVTGVYNGCYITNLSQFNSMVNELYEKGVDFDNSVMPMSDVVSFKVIVLN